MNPHEPYILDEASGIPVMNDRHWDWQEGWHAAIEAVQRAINSQGTYPQIVTPKNLGKPGG